MNLYRGGEFKNDAIAPLANLQLLEGLNLHGCYKLTAGATKTLAELTALHCLNVCSIKISDGALKKLAALPLEELYVHDTKISDQGLLNLVGCTTLRRLNIDFGNVEINDPGIQALSTLINLEELGTVTPAASAALAALPKLKRIRLDGNSNITRIGDAHCEAPSTSLEGLSLGSHMQRSITDAGLLGLARIPSLTLLRFRDPASPETAETLREAGILLERDANSSFDAYVSSGFWTAER